MPTDPRALLRSRAYLRLLIIAAALGVPVSAAAYGFLALVGYLQPEIFTHLPHGLGFQAVPVWWPLPVLAVGGLLTGLAIRYLPGTGGAHPAEGFKTHRAPTPAELPGVILAALATLIFGAVLGPEAPLIAIGGGLVVLALRAARRDVPDQATAVLASAGSFAAISTLLGSPIIGAFLLMEASGLGGPMLGLVLVPGLLAAGIGSLIFLGLDAWTGLGTFSLAVPGLPHFGSPTIAEFGWAIVVGLAAALLGAGIRWLGLRLQPFSLRSPPAAALVAGLVVAGLAIAYAEGTGKNSSDVLFSGQDALGPLITHTGSYTVGALLLLLACKSLAYGVSLSSFRGGPIFPALFIGAAGGMALSHLPGLPLVAGVATGIGAMSAAMLTLPLTSVLLATLLLASDGLAVMPLVIVAVVVAYVASARITPAEPAEPGDGHTGRGRGFLRNSACLMLHIRVVTTPGLTGRLLDRLADLPGIRNLIVLEGAARPSGDAVFFDVDHSAANPVFRALRGLSLDHDGAVTVEQVDASLASTTGAATPIGSPASEIAPVWEMVEAAIRGGAVYSPSFFGLLAIAALIGAVGILTNSQILIVGAMVVGPEYSAIIAAALGISKGDRDAIRDGLLALAVGFSAAIVLTFAFGVAVRAAGQAPAPFLHGVRPVSDLINSPNWFSVVVAILAGIVGVVSLTQARSGALIGVFISVTTIPAAAAIGLSVAFGSWNEAGGSALQLLLNVVLLIVVGAGGLSAQRALWARGYPRKRPG